MEHENTVTRCPFPKLHHFSFATPKKFDPPSEDKLSLEMLKWMPHIKSLDCFHQNPGIPATLLLEIQVIGRLIAGLEKFNLGLFSTPPATISSVLESWKTLPVSRTYSH
jgi:hypothetical protein